MFVHEARMIYETYMDFRDDDEEMPESVKHLYSWKNNMWKHTRNTLVTSHSFFHYIFH